MAARRALSILPSALRLRGFTSVALQPAELQGVYNFGATSGNIRPGEIGEVSGVPDDHLNRKVVIYSPARAASQQGAGNTGQWKISFESTQKWENPLMGWTSTGDPYSSVADASLLFDTKEAAIEFTRKYGWEYTVREPQQRAMRIKAYADKFKWKGPAAEE